MWILTRAVEEGVGKLHCMMINRTNEQVSEQVSKVSVLNGWLAGGTKTEDEHEKEDEKGKITERWMKRENMASACLGDVEDGGCVVGLCCF